MRMVFPMWLLFSSIVWLFLFFPIAADYDYSDVNYEAGLDKSKVCNATVILAGKKDCLVMTGTLDMNHRPFPDFLQENFHSVRTIAGHVLLNDCGLIKLHAFKNVWDIEISDVITWNSTDLKNNPEFLVTNNPNLTEIDLGSLLSYGSTYSQGFRIRNNGNYKMSWKQRNELYRMTNNRDLYDDIDMENTPPKDKSNKLRTVVAYLFLVPMILAFFVWILLLCFYRSADKVFVEVHSRSYEEVLKESKRAAEDFDYSATPKSKSKEKEKAE